MNGKLNMIGQLFQDRIFYKGVIENIRFDERDRMVSIYFKGYWANRYFSWDK